MEKENTIKSKLTPVYDGRKSFYGKAVVIKDARRHTTYLRSYQTIVCKIVNGRFYRCWNGYSATTARHIHDFRLQNGFAPMGKKEWQAMPVVKP